VLKEIKIDTGGKSVIQKEKGTFSDALF